MLNKPEDKTWLISKDSKFYHLEEDFQNYSEQDKTKRND